MNSFLFLFSLTCVIEFLDGRNNGFRCDYTHFKEAKGYFKFHEIPSNWHEAQLRCFMEGSVLVSPLNKALKDAMEYIVIEKDVWGVLTGINSIFSRGDLFSIEGVPLSKIPHSWSTGEPDNLKNEEGCIAMLKDGKFADVNCAGTLPYICYKKDTPGMVVNACGTTDDAYKFDNRTGSCYKYHSFPRTWSRGFMTCAAEGAYLAIINSDTEATLVKELMAKHPNIVGVGAYRLDVANLGVHDWHEHGEWRTIHGQTLAEAGYGKFAAGQPDNYTTEYCIATYRDGLLDDTWCDTRAAFICEKDPAMLTCPDED